MKNLYERIQESAEYIKSKINNSSSVTNSLVSYGLWDLWPKILHINLSSGLLLVV